MLVSRSLCLVGIVVANFLPVAAQGVNPEDQCIATYLEGKSAAPLRRKLVLDEKWSLEKLSDKSKPTAAERKALEVAMAAVQACRELGEKWRGTNLPPTLRKLWQEETQASVLLMADLYAGKLTYGEHNRRDYAATQENKTKWLLEVEALRQKQAESQASVQRASDDAEAGRQRQLLAVEAERQRQVIGAEAQERQRLQANADREQDAKRQAALQMLRNGAYQLPTPPVRPVTTTQCSTYGGQTTCTTR